MYADSVYTRSGCGYVSQDVDLLRCAQKEEEVIRDFKNLNANDFLSVAECTMKAVDFFNSYIQLSREQQDALLLANGIACLIYALGHGGSRLRR